MQAHRLFHLPSLQFCQPYKCRCRTQARCSYPPIWLLLSLLHPWLSPLGLDLHLVQVVELLPVAHLTIVGHLHSACSSRVPS
ncbi:hypothetical protein HanIR_Chr17g0846201 [Helianthus annuus]|nr:hypothetical protein HanIR_Chr17g0846201 [Helianthus annuus]